MNRKVLQSGVFSILLLLLSVLLGACGGGGSTTSTSASGPTGQSSTLSGTAASGAAIVGRIYLKDANGIEHSIVTADGNFSFALNGLTAPYLLKAEWTSGSLVHDLYSFSDAAGHANITPLTQLLLVAASGNTSLDTIYANVNPGSLTNLSAKLPSAMTALQNALRAQMTEYGITGRNPITMTFATDHTGMDALLDHINVAYTGGSILVTDTSSGAVLLQAPAGQLTQAVSPADWTATQAAVASDIDLAVNNQGVGLAVWTESVNGQSLVRARFLNGSSNTLTLSSLGDAGLPRVTFDANDNAIVVWTQYANTRNEIWATRYIATSSTWTTAQRISAASAVDSAYVPDLAIDASGNAFVCWHQGDGRNNHFDAWCTRFVAATSSWSTPGLVSDGVNSAYDVRVALNASGQGLLAWEQEQGDGTTVSNGPKDIWARSIDNAGALASAHKISTYNGANQTVYGQLALAMAPSGDGAALWVQSAPGLPFVIQAAQYIAGAWSNSIVLNPNAIDNSYAPQLAFNVAGQAIAVWQQQTGSGAYGAYALYQPGMGWGVAGQFADNTSGDVYAPRVVVDAYGNANATWYRINMNNAQVDVMLGQYLYASGWNTAQIFSPTTTDGFMSYPVPRIAINGSGQTVAVWGVNSN